MKKKTSRKGEFYIDPSESNGFIRGINFQYGSQVQVKKCRFNRAPATVYKFFIGIKEGEKLKPDLVPDGTEAIFYYVPKIKNKPEVVHYLHYFKEHEDAARPETLKIVLKPFCNRFVDKNERLNLGDFLED